MWGTTLLKTHSLVGWRFYYNYKSLFYDPVSFFGSIYGFNERYIENRLWTSNVVASILSKRWSNVWTGLPNIDIDDSFLFLKPNLATNQSVYTSFTNFLTKVLNRDKNASLCKFALTCSKFDVLRVNEWILAAVKNRVRELVLSVTIQAPFTMSCGLFAYKELVTLKLSMNSVLKVPNGRFCFPSLKELHLGYVVFDDKSIHNFLSRCPVLEELRVVHCCTSMWDNVVFRAPVLKVFVINTLPGNDNYHNCNFKLIVDAPSLEVLNYTGYLATKGYCFRNLNSLNLATLDVGVDEERDHMHCALDLFRGVANAETITLTGYTLEVLHLYFTLEERSVHDFPFFKRLSKLQLGGNLYCGKVLRHLLYLSPNLEVLVIDEDLAMKGDLFDFYWNGTVKMPEFLTQHLKVIEIWGFDNQIHVGVGEFIRDIMSNARGLTKVTASRSKSHVTKKVVEVNDELLVYLSSPPN